MSILSRWKNREKEKLAKDFIGKAPVDISIPLSHGQNRLWFLQQMYPKNTFYNYSESLTFEGVVNVEFLKRSIVQIFNEQEVLNSYYPIENNGPVLRVSPSLDLHIAEYDFSTLLEERRNVEINSILTEQANTNFNLSVAPLYRISLIKCTKNKYILFLTFHHIIVDQWSLGIFKHKLSEYYGILLKEGWLASKKQDIQFSDFAYWERNSQDFDFQKTYWKEVLGKDIPNLDLQTDYKRPFQPTFRGLVHTQNFSEQLSKDILLLAQKLEVTPFVLILSVFNLLLFKHTGKEDILIGTPISKRSQKSLEELMGFFINTIVLRNSIHGDQSFISLVREVRSTTLKAFSNKDLPFDILVKELKPERSLMTNPFFQVMFLYIPLSENPLFGPQLRLSDQAEFDTRVAKFDLTLIVNEKNGRLSSSFEYASDLFEETTIQLFQEHLRLIMEQIVKAPDAALKEITILTSKEEDLFFPVVTEEVSPFKGYHGIHEVIDEMCETHKDNTALVFGNSSISYAELDTKAEAVAGAILNLTQGEQQVVGLCIDRSMDMIIGLLGILRAGCAYLPIDPEYPMDRRIYMLRDSKATILLTQVGLAEDYSFFNGVLLNIEQLPLNNYGKRKSKPKVSGEHLAYIIYTSGSTGKPKGVPITHANLLNSTEGRLRYYSDNPTAFLLMSSISFDSSKAGIYWTLCTGGTLIISEKRMEQDIDLMCSVIAQNLVSHTLMLPSLYKMLMEFGTKSQLESLNTVIVAGEVCTSTICEMHFNKLPNVSLYNEYGPTEATVWCISHQINKMDVDNSVPIGRPVANSEVYLLDKNHKTVPWGAVGEIYVGGPGLADGYLNRPDLTKKAFIPHPFDRGTNKKLYKTGDLGRFRKDGTIEFLGRADQQVKIRGYRIELDEIEKVIMGVNGVKEAVVVVEDPNYQEPLFSVNKSPTVAELEKLLSNFSHQDFLDNLLDSIQNLSTTEKEYLLGEIRASKYEK